MLHIPKMIENETMADLQFYGLSLKIINRLEDGLDCFYLRHLDGLTLQDIKGTSELGEISYEHIKKAVARMVKAAEAGKLIRL